MKARWVCKDRGCRQWGTGGPEGWTRHWRLEHIVRGPCGAWHWVGDHRSRTRFCRACQRLGGAG